MLGAEARVEISDWLWVTAGEQQPHRLAVIWLFLSQTMSGVNAYVAAIYFPVEKEIK